jgi:hypothetical protein
MAGLSNFIANTATQSTSMPTWYDQAQQNVVNQATTGAGNVPSLGNTVAGGAINQLSNNATNPFMQAQGTLSQIGSGAANPWITDTSGNVAPDTSTAMGGLFQAQNQQLNQLMPNYTAPVEGANIASGNFGSLRGQTAVNKAKADAFAQLLPAQMQAALQNQQTGVQAGIGQGQVGSQGVTSMTGLGQAQQSDPLFAASALGKIVGGINAPTTTKNETQLSPLNQIGSIASALGGSISGTNKLLTDLGIKGGLPGYLKSAGINFGGNASPGSGLDAGLGAGTYPLADGSTMEITSDGYRTINKPDGTSQTFDKDGNLLNSGRNDQYGDTDTTPPDYVEPTPPEDTSPPPYEPEIPIPDSGSDTNDWWG